MPILFVPFGQAYDALWLAAAFGLAVLTLYAAPGMSARVAAARGPMRLLWAVGAVSALGIGLWAVSFTVLVARRFDFPALYYIDLTVSGLALTFAGVILSLWLATRPRLARIYWLAGAALVSAVLLSGGLITALSLQGSAEISFKLVPIAAGLVLTLVLLARLLHFMYGFQSGAASGSRRTRLGLAVLLGAALTVALWLFVAGLDFQPLAAPTAITGVAAIGQHWHNTFVAALLVLVVWLSVSGSSWRVGRLNYAQKFALVSGLFLLPLLVVLALLLSDIADRRDKYGVRELYGVHVLRPLQAVLDDVRHWQSLWSAGGLSASLAPVEARLDASFAALEELDRRYGGVLETAGRVQGLRVRWERLSAGAALMDPAARDAEAAALAAETRALIAWVGDSSYLILDPALDTYYMMDAALLKLPEAQDLLWQLREAALRQNPGGEAGLSETVAALALVGRLEALFADLPRTYAISYDNDATGTMRRLVERPLAETTAAASAFTTRLEAGQADLAAAAAAEAALAANRRLYAATSQALEYGVERRISVQTTSMLLYAGFSAAFILVGAVAGLGMLRAISRPLQELDAATRRLAGGDMTTRVPVFGQDEMARVSAAFNDMVVQLQATTGALEARTRDLAAAAEVSGTLARERDLTALLAQSVDLICARFGLYHAQVYLLDPARHRLVLRASAGEAGRELLRRGHSLPVDLNSLNGTAVTTRQAVVIANAQANPAFRPNPLLPETRSEMVVPLLLEDRVIGALDLQSERVGGLSAENEHAFRVLADQLAGAIEGSRLFTQLEQVRVELVAQTRRLTRTGWQEFLDAVHRAERLEHTHIRADAEEPHPSVLQIPLEIAGEAVGALSVECEADRAWAPDEVELVQVVARQAAQQVENLRLLALAEQYRAEAERAVRRLTLEGWRTYQQDRVELQAGFVYTGERVEPASGFAPAAAPVFQQVLAVDDEPIGTVEIDGEVSETDAEMVSAVAERLSRHLEALRLMEQSQQRAQEMEVLSRIGQTLIAQPDLAGLLRVAGDTILNAFGADQGYIALYAADRDCLEFSYYRVGDEYPKLAPAPLGDGVNSIIVRSGEPLLINRDIDRRMAELGARAVDVERRPRAWLGVPLLSGRTTIGLISLQSQQREEAFSAADVRLLTTIAASLSTAIQNARLHADTRQRADREAIINAISQKIQGAVTVQSALQLAVQELGAALKARRASVTLTADTAGPRNGNDLGHPEPAAV